MHIDCDSVLQTSERSFNFPDMDKNDKASSSSTPGNRKKCEKCGALVKDLYNHNYHTHQEKVNSCPVCKKMFKRNSTRNLRKHIEMHDAQPMQCDLCHKFVVGIAKHMKYSHIETGEWSCGICGRNYKNKEKLNTHRSTHAKEPKLCDICDLKVADLNAHKARVHSEAKLFKCTICEKMIKNKCDLKKHIAKVHAARPVKCVVCNSTVKNLNAHNKKVHQEATFRCNICEKKFKTKGQLNSHSRTHEKESAGFPKPIQNITLTTENKVKSECIICLKRFGVKEMRFHMKHTHSILEKRKCIFCNNSYDKTDLNAHISRIHKKN